MSYNGVLSESATTCSWFDGKLSITTKQDFRNRLSIRNGESCCIISTTRSQRYFTTSEYWGKAYRVSNPGAGARVFDGLGCEVIPLLRVL